MKIAVIGVGKLGWPHALTFDRAGHQVSVFDASDKIREHFEARTWPHVEQYLADHLPAHKIRWVEPSDLDVDICFVAVQTPHDPKFDGTRLIVEPPQDFDYTYLARALVQVQAPIVAVISTVLPGTWRRHFQQVENYVYNPSFVAMGTVIPDLRRAEFNLIGTEGTNTDRLEELWRTVNDAPILQTGITEAEAVKVAYNTFISAKVALANTWGWLADSVGFDSEAVTAAWQLADRRLLSGRYLNAGMADGGACHPRDLIALSWLAREYGVYDLFGDLIVQREAHLGWLAAMLPDGVVIFGKAYKADVDIPDGSPSLLLADLLTRQGKSFTVADDPEPSRYNFIATPHSRYKDLVWPEGATVVDPHGIIPVRDGVKLIRPGR